MRPPDAKTIPDLLDELADRYPDHEALVGGETRLSYRALRGEVRRLAKGLHALGVRRGDKVGLLMGNRPEWLLADFAITMLGGTMVAINTWATARELAHVLRHSDTRFLITVDRFLKHDYLETLDVLEREGDALAGIREIVRVGGPADHPARRFETLWDLAETVDDAAIEEAQAAVRGEDVAYLLYTSGTTALPKGVQLQHYALIENMWNIGERQHLRPGDRLWLAVSLFWGLACENALFAVMTHAGCIVLQEHFDAGRALRLIEAERCTVFYGTPNMVHALERHPERPDARHLLSPHRRHAGLARADQAPDRSRRQRDLQHLRTDRDLRQFQRDRRGRPAGEAPQHGRPDAAGHGDSHRRPGKPEAAADWLRRRNSGPGLCHLRLLQGRPHSTRRAFTTAGSAPAISGCWTTRASSTSAGGSRR